MRLLLCVTALFLSVSFYGCFTPSADVKDRQEFASLVDELCHWTGMKRSGRVRYVERSLSASSNCDAYVSIAVDGHSRPFRVRFDSKHRLLSFAPHPLKLSKRSQALGSDTVKEPVDRSRCIAAVDELNHHLQWTWYGRAAIQKVGSDFIVTYMTVSPEQEEGHLYVDPYVSFLVTPKGTVYAVFFGA